MSASTKRPAARVRATSPDEALRACELTQRRQIGPLDTLAAACTEAGNYADAVSMAQAALLLAQAAGPVADTSELAQHLQLFEAGKALREAVKAPVR
jgi:hypothetical protein